MFPHFFHQSLVANVNVGKPKKKKDSQKGNSDILFVLYPFMRCYVISVVSPNKSKCRKETFEVVSDRCDSRAFCLVERCNPMLKKTSQQELLRNTMEGNM